NVGIVTNELQTRFVGITGLNMIITGYFGTYRMYKDFVVTQKMIDKAKGMADFMKIAHLNNEIVNTMSSGEQRRFLIARALVNKPNILILDEPTNSLDVKAIQNLRQTMCDIIKNGKNIILVTHTTNDIIPEITRIVMVKNGKIFADGLKEDLLKEEILEKLFEMKLKVVKNSNEIYNVIF
ncbi:MAG: ATP-binding cassette domain-containing protein, partial [Rickettsiales bacterium]|nr:ATP-binding cassette domain-containing protein [Rickettsiales bacterium]